MKRRVMAILALLLLGAIVNVAVAIGFAFAVNPWLVRVESSDWGEGFAAPNLTWTVERRSVAGATQIRSTWRAVDATRFAKLKEWGLEQAARPMFPLGLRNVAPPSSDRYQVFDLRGFPCLSLWTERKSQPWQGTEVALKPIWPGFAINTVFYAAVLWLLFAAASALRRRRRIRRGLCPKCGYDLRGSPRGADATACPECGFTIR
jgi:hypothetical protein